MKQHKFKLTLLLAIILSAFCMTPQGALLNLKYVTYNGVTDTINNAPILIDVNNKVVVAGNKKINATQYDAITAQSLSNGIMTWTASFNLSTQKAWVTASTDDPYGNFYETGGVATGTANGVDVFVIKYSGTGSVLWSYTYNGPNSTTDIGTSITVDAAGDVYICASSDGTLISLTDYSTQKIDGTTGTMIWESRYNYANSIDIPTTINFNSVSGNIDVSGYSGSTYTDWDFCVVSYSASSGSQQNVRRTTNPGAGQDMAFCMATDTLGNVYTTGTIANLTGGHDIQTMKLDAGLNVIWTATLDVNGFDDAGFNIAIDDSLNVIVTGAAYYNNTNRNLLVLKYDMYGTLLWKVQKRPPTGGSDAEGVKVIVKNENEIFIGGNFTSGGNQDIAILRYNKYGKQTLEKTYNGTSNAKDQFLDFVLDPDSNFIYVSARTYSTGTLDANITIKYEYKDFPYNNLVGTSPAYIGDELVICFHPSTLKMATINDRETKFGKLGDFVQDSVCNKINAALGGSFTDSKNFTTRKIFFDLTEADSISQSRSGNNVYIPKFYANLLINIPETYSLIVASDSINRIKPDIFYSELNFWITPTAAANDTLYGNNQLSLHTNTIYPNAHINADSCWAITSGVPDVRVGLYDTGVEFDHEDLVGVNWGGYNFADSQSITPGAFIDDGNHGTPNAGIIGARRNNNIGIAGIAGGDADSNKIGVSLYDCRIMINSALPLGGPLTVLANAINTGAKSIPAGGFGLHVMSAGYKIWQNYLNYLKDNLIQDQIAFANRNGVAFIAPKSNYGIWQWPMAVWPADWQPEIVSCVGGSGNDGERAINNINCGYGTDWGHNLDFVAPGSYSLVTSLNIAGQPTTYSGKSGNSFATPHVSGVVSLMMSYWNNINPSWDNLVHEDCEYLLKRACTDLTVSATYSETIGPDAYSGNGRINAFKTLKSIDKNNYRIKHIDASHFATSYSKTQTTIFSNYQQYWPAFGSIGSPPMYLPTPLTAGVYSTQVDEITTTINYTLNPGETIIGYWPLYKESCGWDDDTLAANVSIDKPYYSEIVSVTPTQAILKTWLWYNFNTSAWYPTTPANAKSNIVLYTYSSTLITGIKKKQINESKFQVYPNPSNNDFKLAFYSEVESLLNYKIFDILGREIKAESFLPVHGNNNISLNFKGGDGIYILKLMDGNQQIYTQKLLKNEN